MAEVNGERLKSLIEHRRTTQSAVAEATGLTQPSIARLIDGRTRETGKLLELAAHLKTTPEYLTNWADERDLPETSETDRAVARAVALADRRQEFHATEVEATRPGMVLVKEFDLSLGLGGTFLDSPAQHRELEFPADWLRQFTTAPAELIHFVRGKGDSMYPTIMDGDICLLDASRQSIDEQDALWAVSFGDLGMIKRLRKMPDGTVKIMSDNKEVPDEVATDGELYIWARCRAVLRRV